MDRRKTLESARKYAQRGAREKALAQYETLLRLDPRDTRLRLEFGDVHRSWGHTEQAIAHYGRVAGQFRTEGFEARAVAVWKRILQLDAKRYEAYIALSELYQHLGMQSLAIDSLQEAIDGLYREGRTREALENLRRMGQLDPANTTSRQKVADLLVKEGMLGDATKEFEEIIAEFERVENFDSVPGLYERLLELNPDETSFRVALARSWLRIGRLPEAEDHAQGLLASDPGHIEATEVLLEVCRELGRDSEAATLSRRLAESYRDRGDDELASELTQRLPGGGAFDLGHAGDLLLDSSSAKIDFGPDEIENVDFGDVPHVDDIAGDPLALETGQAEAWDREIDDGPALLEAPFDEVEAPVECSDPRALALESSPEEDAPLLCEPEETEIEIACGPVPFSSDEEEVGPGIADGTDSLSIDAQLEEAKFYLDQSLHGEAEAILERILAADPGHPMAVSYLAALAAQRPEPREDAGGETESPEPDDGCPEPSFPAPETVDPEPASPSDPRRRQVQSTVEGGMEEIFADFKRGVNEELSAGDMETRFDLGIAYREMGLYEDARVEFEACLALEARRVDGLQMMALCARDLERPDDAVRYLEQALESEGLSVDRRNGLSFDLGTAREHAGDLEGALAAYRAVEDPDFPGLESRRAALEAGAKDTVSARAAREDAFESFEDLVEEAEAFESRPKKVSFV